MPAHVQHSLDVDHRDDDSKIPPLPDDFLRYDNHWRSGLRQFQVDLEAGRHDPEWQRQAAQAVRERAAGKFDSFKEREYEMFWGQKQRTDSNLRAGESAKVKLGTLIEHGLVQVGDVWKYSRLVGSRGGTDREILIEKETKIVAIDGASLSFAVPAGQRVFLANSAELDEIDPMVLQNSEASLPSSSQNERTEDGPLDAQRSDGSLTSGNNDEAAQPQRMLTKIRGSAKRGRGGFRRHGAPRLKEERNDMKASIDRLPRGRGRGRKRRVSALSERKSVPGPKDTEPSEEPPPKRAHTGGQAVHGSHPDDTILSVPTGITEQHGSSQQSAEFPAELSAHFSKHESPKQSPGSSTKSGPSSNQRDTIPDSQADPAFDTESFPAERGEQISAQEPPIQSHESPLKYSNTSDELVPDSEPNDSAESGPAGTGEQIPAHEPPHQARGPQEESKEPPSNQQEMILNDILVRNIHGPNALMSIIHVIDGRVPKPPVYNAWKAIRCFRNNQDMGSLWEIRQAWFVQYMSERKPLVDK